MADNGTLFEKSLSRFLVGLSDSEKEDFKYTTLQDVHVVIGSIQDEQGKQRKMRNLTRIRSFIEAMSQFGSVVEVMLNASNFVAFIWGPIKCLLLIAKTWTESLDILLDAYEQIGETIPLLLQYEKLFASHSHIQRVLGYIYEDILEFHRRALVVFKRKAWKQMFHATWKTFNTQFDRVLDNLKGHVALIERQASLVDIEITQETRKSQDDHFIQAERRERDRQLLSVTEKISPVSVMVDQEKASEYWLKGQSFGLWLLENPKMKAWLDHTNNDAYLLWIKGIPGSGKTVLTSRLIAFMQETSALNVVFFYFKGDDSHRNSLIAILKSLLCQLLSINSDVLSYIYEECVKSREVTIESLKVLKVMVTIALDHGKPLWFILDGLDECDAKERKKILAWILPLVGRDDESGHLRLLIVSRDEGDFGNRLFKAPWITLQEMAAHTQEIRVYTTRKMAKIQKKFELSKQEAKEIGDRVNSGAKGMFLFARLILKHLRSQTSHLRLRAEVNPSQFPDGLDQVYERIVKRIYTNPRVAEREDAKLILEWIVCARRPLRWNELQATFSIDLETEIVDFEGRCLRPKNPESCHSVVKNLCGSLAEISKGNIIHLVHDTAKIYLTRENNGEPPRINIPKKEFEISKTCLNYLSFPSFSASLKDEEIINYLSRGYYAFQEYAMAYSLDHLDAFMTSVTGKDKQSMIMISNTAERFLSMSLGDSSNPNLCYSELQVEELRTHLLQRISNIKSVLSSTSKAITRDKTMGPVLLQTQLGRRRNLFENLVVEGIQDDTSLKGQYSIFYGDSDGWFKCSIIKCYGFWEGFHNREARENHAQKHDRPFRCASTGCPHGILGFGTFSELERHRKSNHTTPIQETHFPTPLPAPDPGTLEHAKKPFGIGEQDASDVYVLDGIGNELGRLDLSTIPGNFKTVEEDWYAIYNPRESQSLNIELSYTFQMNSAIWSIAWSPHRTLIALRLKGSVSMFNYDTGIQEHRLQLSMHDHECLTCVAFNPVEDGVIAVGIESSPPFEPTPALQFWNFDGEIRSTLNDHRGHINAIDYSSDGLMIASIASTSADNCVQLWNILEESFQTLYSIENLQRGFSSVAFSPDTRLIAAGCSEGLIYLWNTSTLSLTHIFPMYTGPIYDLAFSPSGHHIYSSNFGGTVSTWETGGDTNDNFAGVEIIKGPLASCHSLAITANGNLMVCGSMDGGIYLYSIPRRVMVCALFGYGHEVISVNAGSRSTEEEGMFVTGSVDGKARVWRYTLKDRSG